MSAACAAGDQQPKPDELEAKFEADVQRLEAEQQATAQTPEDGSRHEPTSR